MGLLTTTRLVKGAKVSSEFGGSSMLGGGPASRWPERVIQPPSTEIVHLLLSVPLKMASTGVVQNMYVDMHSGARERWMEAFVPIR